MAQISKSMCMNVRARLACLTQDPRPLRDTGIKIIGKEKGEHQSNLPHSSQKETLRNLPISSLSFIGRDMMSWLREEIKTFLLQEINPTCTDGESQQKLNLRHPMLNLLKKMSPCKRLWLEQLGGSLARKAGFSLQSSAPPFKRAQDPTCTECAELF